MSTENVILPTDETRPTDEARPTDGKIITDEELAAYYGRPTQFKQLVYDLMIGALNLDEYPISAGQYIANEYEGSGTCDKLYLAMTEARSRVYEKLGCEYDEDVEVMVDRCFDICQELCFKMYDYGAKFGE